MTDKLLRAITIDPPGSQDHDDAIWLDGAVLTVCVPDVAAAIDRASPIEKRAYDRGCTRYHGSGRAENMLPTSLSEVELSLHAGEQRRAICVEMRLDCELDVAQVALLRADLSVEASLVYGDVPAALSDAQHAHASLAPMLRRLAAVAERLASKRRRRGELAFVDLRAGWISAEEGQLRRLELHEMNVGFLIVQEMMILANRTLAALCIRRDAPALYRNHRVALAAPPVEALRADLELALRHPKAIDAATTAERMAMLTQRARYGPRAEGHFGLNLSCYGHFTSPLRRYADFVNARVLAEMADAERDGRSLRPPYTLEELDAIGDHLHMLAQQEAKQRNTHARARARRLAANRLETDSAGRLAELSGGDAERVMMAAAQAGAPPQTYGAALRTRLGTDSATPKELFQLLFQIDGSVDAWRDLREEAIEHLKSRPHVAVSLLAMGVALAGWPATDYRLLPEGVGFACAARHPAPSRVIETPIYRSIGKKEARQRAAVALCCILAELEPPAPSPSAPSPPVPLAQDIGSCAGPPATDATATGALIDLCHRALRRKPRFGFQQVRQEDGANGWRCEVTVDLGSGPCSYAGVRPTKQAAKNAASGGLLRCLTGPNAAPGADAGAEAPRTVPQSPDSPSGSTNDQA